MEVSGGFEVTATLGPPPTPKKLPSAQWMGPRTGLNVSENKKGISWTRSCSAKMCSDETSRGGRCCRCRHEYSGVLRCGQNIPKRRLLLHTTAQCNIPEAPRSLRRGCNALMWTPLHVAALRRNTCGGGGSCGGGGGTVAGRQAGRQLLRAFLFCSSFLPNNIISRKLLSSRSKIKQKI